VGGKGGGFDAMTIYVLQHNTDQFKRPYEIVTVQGFKVKYIYTPCPAKRPTFYFLNNSVKN